MRWVLGTTRHPKVIRLLDAVGERAFRALVGLWEWTAANRPDGSLRGMDAVDLKIAAGWPDAPPAFVEALVSLRLLDGKPGRLRVHDWDDAQSWIIGAPARSETAKKAAKARWDKRLRKVLDDAQSNAPSTKEQCPSPTPNPSPNPNPSPSPDPTPPSKRPDVPRGTLPGSNPPGLAAVPDSGGALPAKLAAERERERAALGAFETELARWQAAGNRGGERAFRELRTACLRAGVAFDPDRLYPVPWTAASLRGAPAHA